MKNKVRLFMELVVWLRYTEKHCSFYKVMLGRGAAPRTKSNAGFH